MSHANSVGRVVARIQRLCCAGFGAAAVPEILRQLHDLVPSGGNTCHWGGTNGHSQRIYAEITDTLPLYLQEYQNSREQEAIFSYPEIMRRSNGLAVGDFYERMARIDMRDLVRTEWYNMFPRRLGWEQGVLVTLIEQGRFVGAITLGRTARDADFQRRDMRFLEAVAPFIAHALADTTLTGPFTDTDDKALLLVDDAGTVRHLGAQARRLLLMARFGAWSATSAQRMRDDALPDEVVRLCRRVAGWSETRPLAAPPLWRCRNAWGEFVYRVFPTDEAPGSPAPHLLGVLLERREPLRLKLLRRIGDLPLSNREADICLDLIEGRSRGEIAERLGISETTAIAHCRNLYGKLDVHSRVELAERLRAW